MEGLREVINQGPSGGAGGACVRGPAASQGHQCSTDSSAAPSLVPVWSQQCTVGACGPAQVMRSLISPQTGILDSFELIKPQRLSKHSAGAGGGASSSSRSNQSGLN